MFVNTVLAMYKQWCWRQASLTNHKHKGKQTKENETDNQDRSVWAHIVSQHPAKAIESRSLKLTTIRH